MLKFFIKDKYLGYALTLLNNPENLIEYNFIPLFEMLIIYK